MIKIKQTKPKDKIATLRAALLEEDAIEGKTVPKTKNKTRPPKGGKQLLTKEDLDAMASTDLTSKRAPRASEEALEYRRKQILRLMLRGVPRKTIAEHLGLTITTLYRDIDAINTGLKAEVGNMDLQLFVGMTLSFYDEVRNIGLRMATDTNEKDKRVQLHSLRVALDAETEKHRYLALTGFYGEVVKQSEVYQGISNRGAGAADMDEFADFINILRGDIVNSNDYTEKN